jgi:predicted aspartyl protease
MATYTYDYDFAFSPSAPVAEIEVTSDLSDTPITLVAFIDSGADATMLPFEVLERLQAEELETRYLRTVTGKRVAVDLYRVAIRIGAYQFRSIRAIATDSPAEIILGRDVLNHLIVTLNGLAAVTEISQGSTGT